MEFKDLQIGHYYTHGDDAVYKIIDKGSNWLCALYYSCNHHVASPVIFMDDDFDYNTLYEDDYEQCEYTFSHLVFNSRDLLKEID